MAALFIVKFFHLGKIKTWLVHNQKTSDERTSQDFYSLIKMSLSGTKKWIGHIYNITNELIINHLFTVKFLHKIIMTTVNKRQYLTGCSACDIQAVPIAKFDGTTLSTWDCTFVQSVSGLLIWLQYIWKVQISWKIKLEICVCRCI